MYTYVCTYIHTYIHTYVFIYIYVHKPLPPPLPPAPRGPGSRATRAPGRPQRGNPLKGEMPYKGKSLTKGSP